MLTHTFKERVDIVEFFSKNNFSIEIISFLKTMPTEFTVKAVVDSDIYLLSRKYCNELYEMIPKWERFIRLQIEIICLIVAYEYLEFRLNSNEEKYQRLIENRPHLFQQLP